MKNLLFLFLVFTLWGCKNTPISRLKTVNSLPISSCVSSISKHLKTVFSGLPKRPS